MRLDGYATDFNYANQLIAIIEENKLYQYDNQKIKRKVNLVKYLVVYGKKQDKLLAETLGYK